MLVRKYVYRNNYIFYDSENDFYCVSLKGKRSISVDRYSDPLVNCQTGYYDSSSSSDHPVFEPGNMPANLSKFIRYPHKKQSGDSDEVTKSWRTQTSRRIGYQYHDLGSGNSVEEPVVIAFESYQLAEEYIDLYLSQNVRVNNGSSVKYLGLITEPAWETIYGTKDNKKLNVTTYVRAQKATYAKLNSNYRISALQHVNDHIRKSTKLYSKFKDPWSSLVSKVELPPIPWN